MIRFCPSVPVLDEINVLHVAHVPLIDKQTCADLEGYGDKITDNMICAGFDTGAVDTCKVCISSIVNTEEMEKQQMITFSRVHAKLSLLFDFQS